MKVRIHPLFFAAIPLYVLFGGVIGYLLAFLAITIHELAHAVVAKIAGAKDLTFLLMPYGATLVTKGDFPHLGAVLIAGPFANIFLASVTLSACWIIPELYGYLKHFIAVNVALACINLLPAYPLDGGRLLRLLFPAPWARAVTSVMTCLAGGGAIAFFFLTFRISYLIFGVFLLLSLGAMLLGRRNRVDTEDPVYTLARVDEEGRISPATVREGGRVIARLTPAEVTSLLILSPPNAKIKEALGGKI